MNTSEDVWQSSYKTVLPDNIFMFACAIGLKLTEYRLFAVYVLLYSISYSDYKSYLDICTCVNYVALKF